MMTSQDDGTTPAAAGDASAALNSMSQAERLFALGALLIVAVDLIGGIIAERYAVEGTLWAIGALGIAAVVVYRVRNGTLPVAYHWVLRTLGLSAIVVGIRLFLYDVTGSLFDIGGARLMFALIVYAGAALMGIGALQSKKA